MTHSIIYRLSELKALVKDLLRKKAIGIDSETENLIETRNSTGRYTSHSVPWNIAWGRRLMWIQISDGKQAYLLDRKRLGTEGIRLIAPVLANPDCVKIIHNSAFDAVWWKYELKMDTVNIFDTMNGEKLVLGIAWGDQEDGTFMKMKKAEKELYMPMYSSQLRYCLDRRQWKAKLGFEEFLWDEPVKDTQIEYMVGDVEPLHELMYDQIKNIELLGSMNTLELENKVAEVFYIMTCRGFTLDVKGWKEYAEKNQKIYEDSLALLKKTADINWQAPGQTCKFFGVQYVKELESLELQGPKAKVLEVWKASRKQYPNVSKYGLSWLRENVVDRKVHCSFTQILNTLRCSSSTPNLQNIPALRNTLHRTFFKPRPGNKFGIADFKGQELAIMAVGSGEPTWLACLRAGDDLHMMTGATTFGSRWRSATPEERKDMRRKIKDINFGIAYGMGAERYALKAGISIEEAEEILRVYKKAYRKLMTWLWNNASYTDVHNVSYSFEPFNSRRFIPEYARDRKYTIGKNNPVQSTAANMTKLAMIYLHQELEQRKEQLGLLDDSLGIVHQLHDELIVEWPETDQDYLKETMGECMMRANEAILGERLGMPDVILADTWAKPD